MLLLEFIGWFALNYSLFEKELINFIRIRFSKPYRFFQN